MRGSPNKSLQKFLEAKARLLSQASLDLMSSESSIFSFQTPFGSLEAALKTALLANQIRDVIAFEILLTAPRSTEHRLSTSFASLKQRYL